jgi:hypothetical protein
MCPSFVSKRGEWHPGKESCSMVNDFGRVIESEFITANDGSHKVGIGETFLYNGPDREAVKALKEAGVDHFGRDFSTHPEFLQACRNMGFNDYKDYLKVIGYNEEEENKKFDKKISIINRHSAPKRHAEAVMLAGGKEMVQGSTGENDLVGGFGPEKPRKMKDAKAEGATVKRA